MKKTGWQAGLFGKKLEYLKKHNYFNYQERHVAAALYTIVILILKRLRKN